MNSILVYISLMFINIFTISSSNALTFKLIHRDSPRSPLFQPNLSHLQSYLRDIKTSKTRVSYLKSLTNLKTSFKDLVLLKPSQSSTSSVFIVNLNIGSDPSTNIPLVFDTTAPLTWMQCKPFTNSSFKSRLPIFDSNKSRTFRRINQNHTLANLFNCTPRECNYSVFARFGKNSTGFVSTDRFNYVYQDVIFGCQTNNLARPPTGVTGVLGMANFPTSFVRQVANDARFSYCLSSNKLSKTSFFKIGGDDLIENVGHVQTTTFKQGPLAGKSLWRDGYWLTLIGISVAGKKLDIPKESFRKGCIVDTGSPFSVLEEQAYRVVYGAISEYFVRYKNVKEIFKSKYPKNLCYQYPTNFSDFPSMVWHFEDADLEINPINLFLFGKNMLGSRFLCLQMLGTLGLSNTNILGAYQQQNVRFLYDLDHGKLSFAHHTC
ncbi:hypothetical protein CASFOL_008830 [Castilleja foliolosa]|uniref:Peptidase A1 domain-containing protein n=1 Tax=Castilleja foliolosa TaxID=1961234 RepID=A0ABD3E0M2_9LAMI